MQDATDIGGTSELQFVDELEKRGYVILKTTLVQLGTQMWETTK
jgi:hypothetical protein